MIARKILQEVFDNLPALLVVKLGVDSDTAISMADNCIIDVEFDTVFEVGGNERVIWIYVSKPGDIASYRLAFVDSVAPVRLKRLEKLSPKRLGGDWKWEAMAA